MTKVIELICTHPDAYIEKSCCPAGTRDCACFGLDSVVCPNEECSGIKDNEVDELFKRLEEVESDEWY